MLSHMGLLVAGEVGMRGIVSNSEKKEKLQLNDKTKAVRHKGRDNSFASKTWALAITRI